MRVRRQVLVVSKAPRSGRAKTRLTPPLSPERAAELAEAMLLDTLDGCRAGADVVGVLCPSEAEADALASIVGPAVPISVQHGSGLGAALRETMRRGVAAGPLAIVSSDIPGVPDGAVARAFAALGSADVVLGPALDGGYWLVAMSAFHEAPFRDIPWSTPACIAVTQQRALEAGLRVHRLERWLDIDTAVDLSVAVHEPPGPIARRTAAVLEQISGEIDVPAPPGLRLAQSGLVTSSPWRSLVHDRLAGNDGRTAEYTYLAVPRAVFVVAVTASQEVLLVRQYRHPVRDWTLEVPAGTVEDGESAREAAGRELAEEVGATGGTWRHLGSFFSSSAHLSLRSDAFLVTDAEVGDAHPEPHEELTVVRMPLREALGRARRGGFIEGQTALALLLAAPYLLKKTKPT